MASDDRIATRLKLRDLRILAEVIRAGSMGRAAAHLNLSQPAVSKAITSLEHTVGVRLLDRTPIGVQATNYGNALLKREVAVFDELRQGIRDIEFLNDPTTGELHVGSSEPMAGGPVLTAVNQMSRRFPRAEFRIITGDFNRLLAELTQRNIELAITRLSEPLTHNRLTAEVLFTDAFVIVAGKQNPLTRRRRIALAELANEPWALLPYDVYPGTIVADAFRASGLEPPKATLTTLSLNMRNRLVASGRFLTILPSFSLRLPGRDPSLRALPVELPATRSPVGIVTLRNRTLSGLANLFIGKLRDITRPLTED